MKKRICLENGLKKQVCGCSGEDFSCHPHFQKQEYYIFWLKCGVQVDCKCMEFVTADWCIKPTAPTLTHQH